MYVQMDGVVVTRCRVGTSKKGNEYAVLRFLHDFEQYEIFCMGEEVEVAKKLPLKKSLDLLAELQPNDQNGGVRLAVMSATDENGEYYGR